MNRLYRGFSLVEIMVGLAMGMIAMIVIMQVFSIFEGGKRATTGSADAQSNGAIALFMIERDAKTSGWGMVHKNYGKCEKTNTFTYCDGSEECGGDGTAGDIPNMSFSALSIADGGTGPDEILAQYFSNPADSRFDFPPSTKLKAEMSGPDSQLDVKNVTGCALPTGANPPRVMALISGVDKDDDAEKCTLMEITSADKATLKLGHEAGGMFNPSLAYMEANNWPSYKEEATVTCFLDDDQNSGPPVFQRGYFVDTATRSLRRAEGGVTPAVVAPDIMDLQAEYGVLDHSTEPPTLSWVAPTGAWATPSLAQLKDVRALRVALVARNSQYERPAPGEECATTTAAMVANKAGAFASSSFVFDTTNYPDDWQCYRYKVFETVIPLRNGIWGQDG